MRRALLTALTIGSLCLASAAMAGEGGSDHKGPVDNQAVQPAPLQGSHVDGYPNGNAATSSSGSSGAGMSSGQGGAVGITPSQDDQSYGEPGKVGGRDHR